MLEIQYLLGNDIQFQAVVPLGTPVPLPGEEINYVADTLKVFQVIRREWFMKDSDNGAGVDFAVHVIVELISEIRA